MYTRADRHSHDQSPDRRASVAALTQQTTNTDVDDDEPEPLDLLLGSTLNALGLTAILGAVVIVKAVL